MKKIIIILLSLICFSCNKDEDVVSSECVDLIMYIEVSDTSGENLLNPDIENSYSHEDIKIYMGGKSDLKELADFSFYDNSLITYGEPMYKVNDELSKGKITVVFKNSEYEEIEYDVTKKNGAIFLTKIWYHGELVYDYFTNKGSRYLKIIK